MTLNITDVKDLIVFLRESGVSSFEGFDLKLTFRPDRDVNPFSIPDPEERKKAVIEEFKKVKQDDNSDLFWST